MWEGLKGREGRRKRAGGLAGIGILELQYYDQVGQGEYASDKSGVAAQGRAVRWRERADGMDGMDVVLGWAGLVWDEMGTRPVPWDGMRWRSARSPVAPRDSRPSRTPLRQEREGDGVMTPTSIYTGRFCPFPIALDPIHGIPPLGRPGEVGSSPALYS